MRGVACWVTEEEGDATSEHEDAEAEDEDDVFDDMLSAEEVENPLGRAWSGAPTKVQSWHPKTRWRHLLQSRQLSNRWSLWSVQLSCADSSLCVWSSAHRASEDEVAWGQVSCGENHLLECSTKRVEKSAATFWVSKQARTFVHRTRCSTCRRVSLLSSSLRCCPFSVVGFFLASSEHCHHSTVSPLRSLSSQKNWCTYRRIVWRIIFGLLA